MNALDAGSIDRDNQSTSISSLASPSFGPRSTSKVRDLHLNRLAMVYVRRPLIVALTGYGWDEDRQRSADAGIDFHLLKPADPQELLDLLRAIATNHQIDSSNEERLAATT